MHWLAALLVGHYPTQGAPVLVAMRWWSARGPRASFQRDEQAKLLVEQLAKWGRRVIHTFDQGFAGKLWLGLCLAFNLKFVLRWRADYHLLDATGTARPAWKIAPSANGRGPRAGYGIVDDSASIKPACWPCPCAIRSCPMWPSPWWWSEGKSTPGICSRLSL